MVAERRNQIGGGNGGVHLSGGKEGATMKTAVVCSFFVEEVGEDRATNATSKEFELNLCSNLYDCQRVKDMEMKEMKRINNPYALFGSFTNG